MKIVSDFKGHIPENFFFQTIRNEIREQFILVILGPRGTQSRSIPIGDKKENISLHIFTRKETRHTGPRIELIGRYYKRL